MLNPDPLLPLRDLVWSGPQLRELLDREVLPALRPGTRVRDLHREHTAYKAGKHCTAHYEVHSEGDGNPFPLRITLTVAPPERLRSLWTRHYEDAGPGAAPRALLLDPCLVEAFPSDWKLRDLAPASDPAAARELLGLDGQDGASVEVECLRYRPRQRCVLRYRVTPSEGGDGGAVAKVYHDGSRAAHVREKLRRFGPEAAPRGLDLPALRGRTGDLALVLMEVVAGTNLAGCLETTRTTDEARPLVELAARALAVFHSLTPLNERETRCFDDEIGALRLRGASLEQVAPGLERRVAGLVDRIESRLGTLRADPLCLIHGDFKPSQLLVAGKRPALVDLDRACLGDPALDLGNFLAVLMKQVVLKGALHLGQLAPDFLVAYRQQAKRPACEVRARLFEAFALTRMLVRKVERAPHGLAREGSAWRPLVLLDEAARCLDELGAG